MALRFRVTRSITNTFWSQFKTLTPTHPTNTFKNEGNIFKLWLTDTTVSLTLSLLVSVYPKNTNERNDLFSHVKFVLIETQHKCTTTTYVSINSLSVFMTKCFLTRNRKNLLREMTNPLAKPYTKFHSRFQKSPEEVKMKRFIRAEFRDLVFYVRPVSTARRENLLRQHEY